MANFFDENDIVSEAPQKSSFFDEADLHPEESSREVAGQEVEPDKMSALHPDINPTLRAALVGAGSGATGGFAEELTAPVMAAALMTKGALTDDGSPTLPGEDTLSKFKRLMQEYRDVAREEQGAAQEEHPIAYTGGAIAGGLATMPLMPVLPKATSGLGKIGMGAAEGAGLGAVYGAGEAEGNLQERLPGALEGAKIGAVGGAAIPVAVDAVKTVGQTGKMISKIPIVSDTLKNIKRGFQGESLITSAGRREAADVVREQGGKLYQDIKELQKQVGEQIGAKIDEASQSGQQVDLTVEVNDILDKLQNIKKEGSKEAASYAAGVESEIKKILGIKTPQVADDLSKLNMPEGINPEMINPNSELAAIDDQLAEILVDPKKAQDLKQVLSEYTPKRGQTKPQEVEPAGLAKELRSSTSQKLDEVTGVDQPQVRPLPEGVAGPLNQAPSLNQQYGLLKDSLKRLGVNERRLPAQIKDKITSTLRQLEKENLTGDQARSLIDDVLGNIKQVSPEIADKYSKSLYDAVERATLADKNLGGVQVKGLAGNLRGAVTTTGNLVGLAGNKAAQIPGVKQVGSTISNTTNVAQNFAQKVLESPSINKVAAIGSVEAPTNLSAVKAADEPYKLQRQIAQASENAEPEMLQMEAQDIRAKYGKSGEQLATILENMAGKDKSARRALMYTVLQNPAHRKMLGLIKEEEK